MTDAPAPGKFRIRNVRLQTPDLASAAPFYASILGLTAIRSASDDEIGFAVGESGEPLITVRENRSAVRQTGVPGLYHVAVLVPTRRDLGHALGRILAAGWPLQGASDHLVSEALYLTDVDGNGIEIYADRPREDWTWRDGKVVMSQRRLDLDGILAEASDGSNAKAATMPRGTEIGHVHLQVSDVERSKRFYGTVVGFDVTAEQPPTVAFLSIGGYHHHLAVNSWNTVGLRRRGEPMAGMLDWSIRVSAAEAVEIISRAEVAGVLDGSGRTPAVIDPDGLRLVISS